RAGDATPCKSFCNAGRAHAPAVLRLMTAETCSPVAAEILEKSIVGGEGRRIGLERRERADGVGGGEETGNEGWGGLRTLVRIPEAAHLLHVIYHPRREGRDGTAIGDVLRNRNMRGICKASERNREGKGR